MENEILQLLKHSAGTRFSYKEVGRVVDRRQYREDLRWAIPFLERLAREKTISKDDTLYFFPEDKNHETAIMPCSHSSAVGPTETYELIVDPHTSLEPQVRGAGTQSVQRPSASTSRRTGTPSTPEQLCDPVNRDRA